MKKKRINLFRFFFATAFLLVALRSLQVQFFFGDRLKKWTRSQEREIDLKGPRGKIKDREGRDLALSVETLSFFADPSEIKDLKNFSQKVGKILQMSPKDVEQRVKRAKGRRFVWLKRQGNREIQQLFESHKGRAIEGLGVIREFAREYPHGDILSQLLGRVSIDGEGIEGVERQYEGILQGATTTVSVPRDARGRLFYVDRNQLLTKSEKGKDITLTIDSHLQSLVEETLDDFTRKHKADSALAIVADPVNGEILTWAQTPRKDKRSLPVRNLALTDPIEPGSVVKPLLMAWAFERNFLHEKTVLEIPGASIQIANKTFKDLGYKKREKMSPEELLKYSSNIGAIRVYQRMGFREAWEFFEKIGFLERSGLNLSGESRGIVRKPREAQRVEQATMSFGQGFAVTPVQILRAFSVIAGDGFLRPLKVLKDNSKEENASKVLNLRSAERIRKLMESALMDGGTAVQARVEGFSVAGKTGTSQISRGAEGYSPDSYYASFVGFLPSDNPRFLIYVSLNNPKGEANTGGRTAAPLFAEVARLSVRNDDRLLLRYLEDREVEVIEPVRDLAQVNEEKPASDLILPSALTEVAQEEKRNPFLVPDLVGLHLRKALEELEDKELVLDLRGTGHYVIKQFPLPGAIAKTKRRLVVYLK